MKRAFLLIMAVIVTGAVVADSDAAQDRAAKKLIERGFEMEGGGELDIELRVGGDVKIVGWDRERIEVEAALRGRDWEDIEVDFDDHSDGLSIRVRIPGRRSRSRTSANLTIRVPERFDIELDLADGDIEISGVEGKFSGESHGGDITLERLKGRVRLETKGGDVDVRDSEVDGSVSTLGGDVRIEDVIGDIKGKTLGGDVTYDNVTGRDGENGEVSITTLGGDVNADYKGKDVNIKTMGGDIDIEKGEEVNVTTMGGDIDVRVAPRGAKVKTMGGDINLGSVGKYVRASTMGGDVEIREIDGWVKASTMGGDVSVRMVGDPDEGDRHVELKSMSGDIELIVPEGLSMEFDIELAYTKNSRPRRGYRIVSDFPIEIRESEKWRRSWGRKKKYIYGTGEVNGGKHLIKIRTTNGNIKILKDD